MGIRGAGSRERCQSRQFELEVGALESVFDGGTESGEQDQSR